MWKYHLEFPQRYPQFLLTKKRNELLVFVLEKKSS